MPEETENNQKNEQEQDEQEKTTDTAKDEARWVRKWSGGMALLGTFILLLVGFGLSLWLLPVLVLFALTGYFVLRKGKDLLEFERREPIDLSGLWSWIEEVPKGVKFLWKPFVAAALILVLYIAGKIALPEKMWHQLYVANANLFKSAALIILFLSLFVGEGAKKFIKWAFVVLIAGIAVVILVNTFGLPGVEIAWGDVGEGISLGLHSFGQWLGNILQDAEDLNVRGLLRIAALIGLVFLPLFLWKIAADALDFFIFLVVLGGEAFGFWWITGHIAQDLIFEGNTIRVPQGWAILGGFLFIWLVTLNWIRAMRGKEGGATASAGGLLPSGRTIGILFGVAVIVCLVIFWPQIEQQIERWSEKAILADDIEEVQEWQDQLEKIPNGGSVPVGMIPESLWKPAKEYPNLAKDENQRPVGIRKNEKVFCEFDLKESWPTGCSPKRSFIIMRLRHPGGDPSNNAVYKIDCNSKGCQTPPEGILIQQSARWPEFLFWGHLRNSKCRKALEFTSFKVGPGERIMNIKK